MLLSLKARLEAVLYLKARPLDLEQLAHYAECTRDACNDALIELIEDYAHRDGALEVVDTSGGYALQLRPEFGGLVSKLIPTDLGVGATRTLALIALKGPLTQSQLVEMRGSGAYDHVRDLVGKGFVLKTKEAEGRSYRLRVSEKFFQYFEVDDIRSLVG